jgi:hypothetical protein
MGHRDIRWFILYEIFIYKLIITLGKIRNFEFNLPPTGFDSLVPIIRY